MLLRGTPEDHDDCPRSLGIVHGVITTNPPRPHGSFNDILIAKEKKTRVPVKNAKVSAACPGAGKRKTKTDVSGYYELSDLEDGVWKLKVKAKGYEVVEATVIVSGGGVYEENF